MVVLVAVAPDAAAAAATEAWGGGGGTPTMLTAPETDPRSKSPKQPSSPLLFPAPRSGEVLELSPLAAAVLHFLPAHA